MTEPVYELHPKLLLDAALKYAERGFRVLPLHSIRNNACTCGNSVCKSPGKHPLTLHGAYDATLDPTLIRGYWSEHPFANIGIAMGDNDIVALDVDTRNNGHLSLEALIQQHGPFPDTAVQRTGNGWHYLFRVNPQTIANVRGLLAQGIDISTPEKLFALAAFAEQRTNAENTLQKAIAENTLAQNALLAGIAPSIDATKLALEANTQATLRLAKKDWNVYISTPSQSSPVPMPQV